MTLSEYTAAIHPGAKVTMTIGGTVLHGIAGNLWPGPIPVIKFGDESILQVTEHNVGMIEIGKMS